MAKPRRNPRYLRCAIVLACLTVGAGALSWLNDLHRVRHRSPFAVKFASISPGDTAQAVADLLGTPSQVVRPHPQLDKASAALPVEDWYYRAGGLARVVRLQPPGLDHWDEPLKWRVQTSWPTIQSPASRSSGPLLTRRP